jgi:hypothetical protein
MKEVKLILLIAAVAFVVSWIYVNISNVEVAGNGWF